MQKLETPFYLTGGTALSRCYLQHRYSDDLDFFVNANSDFKDITTLIINKFKSHADWKIEIGIISKDFVRLTIEKQKVYLKVDFVNDIEYRCGVLEKFSIFNRVDSWQNILSNKLCALSRMDAKDIIDILCIAQKYSFGWKEIFKDAQEKDLWVEPIEIGRLISDFPIDLIESIKWIKKFDLKNAKDSLKQLQKDIILGRNNTLVI